MDGNREVQRDPRVVARVTGLPLSDVLEAERLAHQAEAPKIGGSSPWGRIDYIGPVIDAMIDGPMFVSTASHGGVWLPAPLRKLMPEPMVKANWLGSAEWWEEDVDAMGPALMFTPYVFSVHTLDYYHSYIERRAGVSMDLVALQRTETDRRAREEGRRDD